MKPTTLRDAIDSFVASIALLVTSNAPNTIQLPINGRGIPEKLKEALRTQHHDTTSAHAMMERQTALREMENSLKIIRQAHRQSSGGLDMTIWNKAHICLSMNGHDFDYYRPTITENRSRQLICSSATFAQMLENHAALDLSGKTRIFRLAPQFDSALPFTVAAPTPQLAIKRMRVLLNSNLDGWRRPIIHEVLPTSLFDEE